MTERPIIFSGPMVRAILDGRKSQTRRVLKLNGRMPEYCGPAGCTNDPTCWGWEDHDHGDWITLEKEPGQRMGWRDWRGAYTVGDRLWVRETWQHYDWSEDGDPQIRHKADGALLWPSPPEDAYVALNERWAELSDPENYGIDNRAADRRWRPSIHMPKWAARIWLTVTEVRVQRLQWITEPGAMAEGAEPILVPPDGGSCPYVEGFEVLWDSIHGTGAFERNDWVAAITFERAS